MQFDKKKFFEDYRGRFKSITQTQVEGLDFLLDQVAGDKDFTVVRHVAYLLATIKGETGTFQPRREVRANPAKQPKLFRTQQAYFPSGFFGRGYVQLTHRANYLKAGQKLAGVVFELPGGGGQTNSVTITANTFVNDPKLVMQPTVSYLIAAHGMREGWFRGRKNGKPFKLSDFIKDDNSTTDYFGARNIINGGNDRAAEFAGFASNFELILRASRTS